MDNAAPPDIEAQLAARLRGLRAARGLTLDALAERSDVSRSMISLIERCESSPTASVLVRLASGLGVTLASLFADTPRPDPSPLARRAAQRAWRDPDTGYVRRNLSPPGFPSAIELVEVVLPPRAHVAFDGASRAPAIDQQIWVLEGTIQLRIDDTVHDLAAGDCLAMRVGQVSAFRNPTEHAARYLVALAMAAPEHNLR
jgi:transcriptional regulator with XRE-family HTH domain